MVNIRTKLHEKWQRYYWYAALYTGLAIDTRRRKLYYADADAAEFGGNVGELSTNGTDHQVLSNGTDYWSRPQAVVFDEDNR